MSEQRSSLSVHDLNGFPENLAQSGGPHAKLELDVFPPERGGEATKDNTGGSRRVADVAVSRSPHARTPTDKVHHVGHYLVYSKAEIAQRCSVVVSIQIKRRERHSNAPSLKQH
jgi:hypothetical protein